MTRREPSGRPPRARLWAAGAGLIAALAALGWWAVPGPRPAPLPQLRGTPQTLPPGFSRCGQQRRPNCVIDGDTLAIGPRRLRLIGIDAPEIGRHARCPAEAAMAEEAAAALLALVNAGPIILQPPEDGLRDRYGRELMHIFRQRPDGSREDLAATLIASGKVRAYAFGPRQGWCD